MKSSQGKIGRVFVLRLENGDRVPDCVENFAAENEIKFAQCTMLGGLSRGNIVVGPEDDGAAKPKPMLQPIGQAHETVALGTIFPDQDGTPKLHMHAALGREGKTRTGCIRPGLEVWCIGEVVITEIIGLGMSRKKDPQTAFELLEKD